jgi:hypothetical protein
MNVRSITWCVLLILFSQQSVAAVRSIVEIIHVDWKQGVVTHKDNSHHTSDSGMPQSTFAEQHCQGSQIVSSHSANANEQKHCDYCVIGCQSVMFIAVIIQVPNLLVIEKYSAYQPFLPRVFFGSIYRPPIIA